MKTIAVMSLALIALAACAKPAPTVENQANAQETDLLNRAAAMDAEAAAGTNAAAAAAIDSATAAYNGSVRADAATNGN